MTPRKLNRGFALAGITMPTVRAHIERKLEITHTTEPIPAETHSGRNWPASHWSITKYTLNHTERV